jgi:hypothetical protein
MILWVPQLEQILFVVHEWMQMILQYAFFKFLIVGTGNDWEWMAEWEISSMTVRNITSYNLQFMNDHCRYFKKQSCPANLSFHAVLSCSFALEWQSCSFLPQSEFAAIFLSLQCFNTNLTRNGGKVIKCLSFKKILLLVKYAKSWPQNYFLKIVILVGMPCYNSAGMGEIAARWQKWWDTI